MKSKFLARFPLFKRASSSLAQISGAAFLAAGAFAASPVAAHDQPTARLVSCGTQSCLRIEGRRDNSGTIVAINGEPMAVDGSRNWSLILPLGTVRQIADQGARRLEITLVHPATRSERRDYARLPIGLLGNTTDLETIRVTAS